MPRRLAWRRRLRGAALVLLLIMLISALLNRVGGVGDSGDDWGAFDQKTFIVADVIDGDTVRIRPPGLLGGEETPVRLLGIDAPEMHFSDPDPPDYWATKATDALEDLVEGDSIILRLEPTETRDRYDRLLAYLFTPDGRNINQQLVEDGDVYADRRFRHTYRPQFEQAENAARRRKLGLWRNVKTGQMPPWRQRWLDGQPESNRDGDS